MADEGDLSKEELLSYIEILRKSGKLEHVALLDLTGKVLVFSRGMSIGADDGCTIVKVLDSLYRKLTRIKVGHQHFVCFRSNNSSLVGRSGRDFLFCSKCLDFVIVGVSDPESPGSSIFEVTRFIQTYRRRSVLIDANRSHDNERSMQEEESTSSEDNGFTETVSSEKNGTAVATV